MKSSGTIAFYIFIILFIVVAYLNNSGTLTSFLPKPKESVRNVIEIPFTDKTYKLDFTKKNEGTAVEIADFEEKEKWKGEYRVDDVNFWGGTTSYIIGSKNKVSTVLTLKKQLDLSDMKVIKFLVYSRDQEAVENVQKLTLSLNTATGSFDYDILNVKPGWNLIRCLLRTLTGQEQLPLFQNQQVRKQK